MRPIANMNGLNRKGNVMQDDDLPPLSHVEKLLDPGETEKKRQYSFYIDGKLYKKFMSVCKKNGLSGSAVISALMRDFVTKYGLK